MARQRVPFLHPRLPNKPPLVLCRTAHGTISEIERCFMHRMVIIIAALLVVGLTQAAAAAASTSADNRKTEQSKRVDSVRVDVSSAGPERPSSQEPAKQKKRVDSVRIDVSSAP